MSKTSRLGPTIRALRRAAGLDQQTLAERMYPDLDPSLMTRVEFPPQTPEERATGDAWWAACDRARGLYHQHQADQFRAELHAAIEAGGPSGPSVCGASDCQFSRSGEESK